MIANYAKKIFNSLYNRVGWHTNRKLIVIESDDWGSIRMPSKETFASLQNHGYSVEKDPYMMYDNLADKHDLSRLFEVLSSVKDKNGNPAKMTANTIVGNPDFDRIASSGFNEYFYEPFTTTLSKYPKHGDAYKLWKEGINNNVFYPQFHGREHLNVDQWMNHLKNKHPHLSKAFDHKMISISSESYPLKFAFMESLDFYSEQEKESKVNVLNEGLNLFETLFGYKSLSFIANCYIWEKSQEEVLSKNGVKFLQGLMIQYKPTVKKLEHSLSKKYHYLGQKNSFDQRYLIRNVFFEPSHEIYKDDIDTCMSRIKMAFSWKKPAIISSHRLNFIGNIHASNTEKNLPLFETLLKSIIKEWPEVEFVSTDELGKILLEEN